MRVCIHRGTQEIGGTCVEVESQGKRLVSLPLECMGGAYYRAVLFPSSEGLWAWKLTPVGNYERSDTSMPLAEGVLTVSNYSK
jgi:hypothetical protein